MAGTYPNARSALKTQLDGTTWQVTGLDQETLTALEYPPSGQPDVATLPYAYIIPPRRTFTYAPPKQRVLEIPELSVRVVLAGPDGGGEGMERLAKRYEVAVEAIATALDDARNLDGNADVVRRLVFGGLEQWAEDGEAWGFAMAIDVRISESKSLSG